MKLSIIVFRHGALHSKKNLLGGWLNLPLSSAGGHDALVLARKLAGEKIDVAFCSDLLRSKQALCAVLAHHPHAKVIVDHRLRERHLGNLSAVLEEPKGNSLAKNSAKAKDNYFAEVSGGESMAKVSGRVFPFMNDLLRFMQKERVSVAISAHAASMRLIVEFLEGLDHWEASRFMLSPTDYKKYVVEFG